MEKNRFKAFSELEEYGSQEEEEKEKEKID